MHISKATLIERISFPTSLNMASPTKSQVQKTFKKLKSKSANKLCWDCSSKTATCEQILGKSLESCC